MRRTTLGLSVILTLLLSALVGAMVVNLASANFMPLNVPTHNIEITADGYVTGTDKIQRNETVYTFTGDISGSIVVLCDNVMVDGAGYTLQGNGYTDGFFLEGRKGVVIRNLTIAGFEHGVVFSYYRDQVDSDCRDNIVTGNNITNNKMGIDCYFSFNITISENVITNNEIGAGGFDATGIIIRENTMSGNNVGIDFSGGSDIKVFSNNFINNTSQAILDPKKAEGYVPLSKANFLGNFWSDYHGEDVDGNGIGETPYQVDDSYQDNYPRMTLIKLPIDESIPVSESLPTALTVAASVAVVVAGAGLLIYFRKRQGSRSP